MTKDQVLGLYVGCALGDAYGAPFEFMYPEDVVAPNDMMSGGSHGVDNGEWTDDTALMMSASDAYIKSGEFNPSMIANNFKSWKAYGDFGTRDECFDIGATTSNAISLMTRDNPYAGRANKNDSGNGSLMRIAPAIAANHNNSHAAVGEAVALALMTHGNNDTVKYISAYVAQMFIGFHKDFKHLQNCWDIHTDVGTGSIMHSYAVTMWAVHRSTSFKQAMKMSVKLGYDTDTNCAIVGMMYGGVNGFSSLPTEWVEQVHQIDKIKSVAEQMYVIGNK